MSKQEREELENKLADIISRGVTYSAQVDQVIIHGAIKELVKSHTQYAHSRIKDFASKISVHLIDGGEVLVRITTEVERIVRESEKENGIEYEKEET